MSTLAWIVTLGLAMAVIALVGSVTLFLSQSTLNKILLPLVAFAAGSLIGGAQPAIREHLTQFGIATGLAFQIQDDILGIWGDPEVTGKAAGNDILRRKKSLPLLHAINHPVVSEALRSLLADEIDADQMSEALRLLEVAETRAYAEQLMHSQHEQAIESLRLALGVRADDSPLMALANSLLGRES